VLDKKAQHGACAPLSKDKWGANLWIWNGPYHLEEARTAIFINKLPTEVELLWQSATDEVFLDSIAPEGLYESFTFLGHVFVARSSSEVWTFTIAQEPEEQHFFISHAHDEL